VKPSIYTVGITGAYSVIFQCVIIRELLSLLSGNEIVLGIIFSIWLFFSGIGSTAGYKKGYWNCFLYIFFLFLFSLSSILLIRYFPLYNRPGVVISPYLTLIILICSEAPVSFLTGYIFGLLIKIYNKKDEITIYRLENCGAVTGAIILYCLILMDARNGIIFSIALCMLCVVIFINKQMYNHLSYKEIPLFLFLIAGIFFFLKIDMASAANKYINHISKIRYTKQGELAVIVSDNDTTLLINNTLYRSTIDKSAVEQAVHITAYQCDKIDNVLVIFDRGYYSELKKYPGIHIDLIETLPDIASPGSILIEPEKYNPEIKYDCIYLNTALPNTISSNRFYTLSFFRHIHSMMSENSVFSFSLPFNNNYMSADERALYDILRKTLNTAFHNILVFPGDEYSTFMASDKILKIPDKIEVNNMYVNSFILPSVSKERIEKANNTPAETRINTAAKPVATYFALKDWMKSYGHSGFLLLCILCFMLIVSVIILPRSISVLSVATSGFAAGFYTISILVLYQAFYGNLYSEISLLFLALYLGFVAGTFIKKFTCSDLIIGVYTLITLLILQYLRQPPLLLFIIFNFAMGFLCAAQFITRKNSSPGFLYTADLAGGIAGMSLASTMLMPLFGAIPVVICVFIVKLFLETIIALLNQKKA